MMRMRFGELIRKAYDNYHDLYQDKMEELMKDMDTDRAEKEAYNILRHKYKTNVMKQYKFFLEVMHLMKTSPIHRNIKADHQYVND